MARGLGRALARAVQEEGPGPDLPIEGPSLANARRRAVFRYLCLRPCARVGDVGRALSMSQATVRWHAWDLHENGYVQIDGSRMFPPGLFDPQDVPLFECLANPGRAAVYSAVQASPGGSYHDLAAQVELTRQSVSKIAMELSEFGLVGIVEDGRFRRVYPTDRLRLRRAANRPRADAFGEFVVHRLAADALSPELLRRDDCSILLRFGVGLHRVVLDLPLDPYLTAWTAAL